MNELEEKETGLQYFETCMRYILTSGPPLSKDQLNTIIKQLAVTYQKGSEVTMTLAEVLREEGKKEGIEEGETRSYSKIAVKALSKKFGILTTEYREKLSQLDLIALETLNEAM